MIRIIQAFLLSLLTASACMAADQKAMSAMKVAVITVGPVNDAGWNGAHEQGRQYMQKTLGDRVVTTVVENVPESGEVERVMEKLISQGNKLIFSTSYGYLEPAVRVASRHPQVVIMQCQRNIPKGSKNMGTYFTHQFDPMYIAGYVAGKMTKTGKIGYVAAHPVPPVLAVLNAFTMAARKANPKATVQVVWTNSWSDPAMEAEATKGLVDSGADVIGCQLSSAATVVRTAEKQGAYSVGCNSDLARAGAKKWLTGSHFKWGPLYVKIAESVRDHTWKPGDYLYSIKDGYIDVSPFGAAVPNTVQNEARQIREQLIKGSLVVFKGPIKDRNGKEMIAAGKEATAQQLQTMDWLVTGIQGSLPKK